MADFLEMRPAPVRWPAALAGALSLGIPLAVFSLAGREDLGLIASTGGVLASYLGARSRRDQAVAMPLIGAGLVLAAGLGAVAAASLAWSALVLFLVTAVSALLVYGFSVGPPGALFFILSCGVGSHLAAPSAMGGVGRSPWLVVSMTALGCAIAYAVVVAPLLLPRVRRRDSARHRDRAPWAYGYHRAEARVVARVVVGTALGIAVAVPLGLPHVYWVVMTVAAILQGGLRRRVTAVRGLHRVAGTTVGLGLFWVILEFEPHGLWLAMLVAALQFGIEMIIVRNYGLALVLITPLALTIASQGNASIVGLALERFGDTILGAACAAVVLFAGWLSDHRVAPDTP